MKKKVFDDIYVEINLDLGWRSNPTDAQIKSVCEDIVRDVKRHIDNVGQIGIYWETEWVCEFCEYGWEWKDDECPGCCSEAEQEWIKNNE